MRRPNISRSYSNQIQITYLDISSLASISRELEKSSRPESFYPKES